MTYDLIVIGAGPAGCAAAITAVKSGAKVLLLERGRFPRQKVCGEFVSAESLSVLEELLPDDRAMVGSAPRITASRFFVDRVVLPLKVNPPAASIPRFELDRVLWESAKIAGVDARDNSVVRSVNEGTSFNVDCDEQQFFGRALINAAGRWSFLTHPEVRARASGERWIGVKAHFQETRDSDSVDLYFFDGGYCGVQPVCTVAGTSEQIVNACAMVRADVVSTMESVLASHPALKARSQGWKPLMEPVSTSPLVFHDPEPVRGNLFQVGDAATFVDPFIGDGISLALRSGVLAAECLKGFFSGEVSLEGAAASYSRTYLQKLAPVFRASSMVRKFLSFPSVMRKPVMSMLQYTPAITSQLVKLTR
ncbi:MAG TPA: FAD-dependent monooxygenase [Terriglobales bacterium]|nr:FAD-dependent monooxygenase [Terriglobales bacterium]